MGEFSEALMLIDLDKIKTILGIDPADVSQDDALTDAAPIVTEYFENYCRRGLAFDAEVIEELDVGPRLPLYRYPIKEITAYEISGAVLPIPAFEKYRGFVLTGRFCSSSMAKVTYAGGYPQDDVPLDLARAYAQCCASLAGVTVVGGGSAGAGGSAPLKSLSLGSGALAVQFETAGQTANTFDTSDAPPLLQPYVFILRRFFHEYA